MDSLKDIEAGLERLMPRGLSEDARMELEVVVDELCAGANPPVRFWQRSPFWISSAAAVLLSASGFYLAAKGPQEETMAAMKPFSQGISPSGIAVLEQQTWIDTGADLGIQSVNEFGETRRGWSYSGVEEERVLHEDSGYEVILQREFDAELYAASSL